MANGSNHLGLRGPVLALDCKACFAEKEEIHPGRLEIVINVKKVNLE